MSSTAPQIVEDVKAPQSAPVVPHARGKRPKALFIVVGVVAVLVMGVGGYLVATRGQETTDNAQVEADVVPLSVRVAGPVLRVLVQDNAQVHKGDVLAEIDSRDYTVKVKQAEAELASAKAQAAAADAQAAVAEAGAKGGFTSARASLSSSTAAVGDRKSVV